MMYAFDFSYAGITIDAAQDAEGNVWISTPTVERVLNIPANSTRKLIASQGFKAFASNGKALVHFYVKSKSTKHNTTNVYYSKEAFLTMLYYVSDYEAYCLGQGVKLTSERLERHHKAKNLVHAGFIADFEGSIQNALGNQLSEEQREYLRELVFNRLQAFRGWTDVIRDRHLQFYGEKAEGWYYGKLIKKANIALFGVENFSADRTANMTAEQQKEIKDFESFLARMANKKPNYEPEALLDYCLDIFA